MIFDRTLGYWIGRGFLIAVAAVALTACGGDDSAGSGGDTAPPTSPQTARDESSDTGQGEIEPSPPPQTDPAPAANTAPKLSGSPLTSWNVGSSYSFQPSASDTDGDELTFSIANRPSWASFDTATGRLYGTPAAAHAGQHGNILISVSDGQQNVSLPVFSINVTQSSNGAATLSWSAPTQNTDGSALVDLAGYKILYGTDSKWLDQAIDIDNPSLNTYVVENLSPATWHFSVKALARAGTESDASALASKTIL